MIATGYMVKWSVTKGYKLTVDYDGSRQAWVVQLFHPGDPSDVASRFAGTSQISFEKALEAAYRLLKNSIADKVDNGPSAS